MQTRTLCLVILCLVATLHAETSPKKQERTYPVAAVTQTQIKIAQVWCDKPCARVGETLRFSAWIENIGGQEAADLSVELQGGKDLKPILNEQNSPDSSASSLQANTLQNPTIRIDKLPAGSYERVDFIFSASKAGAIPLEVRVSGPSDKREGPLRAEPAIYRLLILERDAKLTRQELMTDDRGFWHVIARPKTLQEGNAAPLSAVKHKTSKEIKQNSHGICTHLPRAKDYEDPFNAVHLIDGDAGTCWSSQQNSSPYPGSPPWVKIDLGRPTVIKQVNLVPYWHNTDFPAGFSIHTSVDGSKWEAALTVKNHAFNPAAPARGDKKAQEFPLAKPVEARHLRVDFERLPLSGGNYAEVAVGYKARLSEIEVVDSAGRNVAPAGKIEANDTFTGWDNTKKTIDDSFSKLGELGVKMIRISQWGDRTTWAAIEREKGKFAVDPATDAAIRDVTDQGIDILWTLDYGNALYNTPGDGGPIMDIGPIFKDGCPFCGNYGPRTEEQRQAFVRFVDYVVNRYKDRVKYWELWNEENGWYPGFEPELYGKLLAAVGKRIKEIDPKLTLVYGGTAAPAPITTEISLREGGAPYVDVYAFHPYGAEMPESSLSTMEQYQGKNLAQTPAQSGWKSMEDVIAGVKKPFIEHGKPDVGVWLNEWGTNLTGRDFAYDPHIGEYGCSKYLLRYYVFSSWLKARTAWWALYNLNKSQDWGILDIKDYGFRPMAYALQNVCSVVSEVTPIAKMDCQYAGPANQPKVIAFARDGKEETLVLVWNAEVSNEEVKNYPSKLSIAFGKTPGRILITDLYWGVSQAADWSFNDGRIVVDRLLIHDYPITVSVE